jgi:HEAT repeat protein
MSSSEREDLPQHVEDTNIPVLSFENTNMTQGINAANSRIEHVTMITNVYPAGTLPPMVGTGNKQYSVEYLASLERSYCEKLRDDPEIAQLQMFNRSEPLPIERVYINVHLYTHPRPRTLSEHDKQQPAYDPLVVARQQEQRASMGMGTPLDPITAIKNQRRCVIVGNPGSGKTTLLKRLTVQSAAGELAGLPALPLYIRLQGMTNLATSDLFDSAVKNVCAYGFSEDAVKYWLEERLNAGDVLVLLDALDETAVGDTMAEGEASYQRVVEAIQSFKKRFNKVPLVVTVRKAAYFYRTQLTGFTELGVHDFQPQEMEVFIQNWFDYYGHGQRSADANRLINELRTKARLATLAKNPLLLTLIVTTYEDNNQELPESRAELYKQCVDTLLTRWDTQRRVQRSRQLGIDNYKALLTRIAWHLHNQGLPYDSRANLESLVADYLESIERPTTLTARVFDELAMHNDSFLREQAHGVYGFLHMTLQEYLAAQYLGNRLDELLPHLANPWWEEVIVLCAGSVQDAAPLLEHLLTTGGDGEILEDLFASKLILAGRCLAARPSINRVQRDHLRATIRMQLFTLLEAVPYKLMRQQIALVLAEIARAENSERKSETDAVTQRLLSLARGTRAATPEVRDSVLTALSQCGSPDVMYALFQWYIDNRDAMDYGMSQALMELVSQFGDAHLSARLLPFIEDKRSSNSVGFRMQIAYLLGCIRDTSVTPVLLSIIHNADDEMLVRRACVLCLRDLKDAQAIPDLLALMQGPAYEWTLALDAVYALEANATTDVVAALFSLLGNASISIAIQENIIRVLDMAGSEELAVKLMQLFLAATIESEIQARIVPTIILHSHHRFDQEFLSLLADEAVDIQIRRAIAWSFGTRSDAALIPQLRLLRLQTDLHRDVHRAIVFALALLEDRSVMQEFSELFVYDYFLKSVSITREFDHFINQDLASYTELHEIYAKLVALADDNFLLQLLSNRSLLSYYRERIARALADTERYTLVTGLLTLLADRSIVQEVRIALLIALEKLVTKREEVEQLVEMWPHNLRLDAAIADATVHTLWTVCRRTGITIIEDGPLALRVIERE